MIGALAIVAGAVLLAYGSLRVAALVGTSSTAAFLLAAYVVAWAQVVLVLWALSLPGWVSRWPLLGGLAVVCAALSADTRGRTDVAHRLRDGVGRLADTLRDPLCAVLGVAVAAGFGYAVVLGLATPQNDFDAIVDHLWRATLWMQDGAAGYPDCACAPYVNAYPPNGELGLLATMTLGGADRYVGLVQASSYLALVVGVVGIARAIGLDRRRALLGALLVATLPVIALQASTAQNDLVVGSFLVAAVVFVVDENRTWAPWLGGVATALAVGTKVTALVALPFLALVALLTPARTRQGARLAGVAVGAAIGAYWYAVNWDRTGSPDGGFPYEPIDHGATAVSARALRSVIQLLELPGGRGSDRWLYLFAAAVKGRPAIRAPGIRLPSPILRVRLTTAECRRESYAHDRAAGQERAQAPEVEDEEPRAEGFSAAPRRLHSRLHHDPEEAELRPAQGRPRPAHERHRGHGLHPRHRPQPPGALHRARARRQGEGPAGSALQDRPRHARHRRASRTARRPARKLRRQEGRRVAMPRKGPAVHREIEPDPVYQNPLVTQLINKVLLDGKKTLAERIVYKALEQSSASDGQRPGDHPEEGGRERAADARGQVPPGRWRFLPGTGRGQAAAGHDARAALARELLRARREHSMAERLVAEIMDASNGTGTSVKRREDMHKMAEANKAFAHYRW